jgi:hypothetical protein
MSPSGPLRDDVINAWLKYHDMDLEKVKILHPTLTTIEELARLYPVTREQFNEWERWCVDYLTRKTRLSKIYVKRKMEWVKLDCAPDIIEDNPSFNVFSD